MIPQSQGIVAATILPVRPHGAAVQNDLWEIADTHRKVDLTYGIKDVVSSEYFKQIASRRHIEAETKQKKTNKNMCKLKEACTPSTPKNYFSAIRKWKKK